MSRLSARVIGGIYRCRNHIWDRDAVVLQDYNLTWPQFVVLAILRGSDAHAKAPKEIGRMAQVTTGGLSKILALLERRGLVARTPNSADGRSRLVILTEDGRATAEQIFERVTRREDEMLREALTDSECEDLARLVRKLSGHLDAIADSQA